jgi:hypothetical protein
MAQFSHIDDDGPSFFLAQIGFTGLLFGIVARNLTVTCDIALLWFMLCGSARDDLHYSVLLLA